MDKNSLIGVSIIAVILLFLGSFTNVVGYQTVQSSNPHQIVTQYKANNQLEQKEATQYSYSGCDCEDENTALWQFPVICTIIFIPYAIGVFLYDFAAFIHNYILIKIIEKIFSPLYQIGKILNCFWYTPYFEELQKKYITIKG